MTSLPHNSHLSPEEPQPEVCIGWLCGTIVGGARLRISEAEGLEGRAICDVTPSCATFRAGLNAWARRDRGPASTIGQSRVYPPGASSGE